MVLPAPPADAAPVEPHWFDKVVVAIELSAHGVLTLVDHAAPSRLREAFLRLRARDPETDLIIDVQRLAELPPGTTVILAVTPTISTDALDWLNLNRPLVADRRLNIVLWCEGDAAAVLARGAPDFFDWISARVDCPPAPAAFAVADVKAAIRARAPGIAWAGPGLEETLAAVRPGRPIRRVAVASYKSISDALTSQERGWLFLDGIDTAFHLRRLRWAMAETRRRVIVFRRAIDQTLPGWWTVHAEHVPIADAVHGVTAAGGSGRLVALTGLDPTALASGVFLLRGGIDTAYMEDLLAGASDPCTSLLDLARPLGWPLAAEITEQSISWISTTVRHAIENDATRHKRDDDPVVSALRRPPLDSEQWIKLGATALDADDFASLGALGAILVGQGDLEGARPHLERSLEISERLGTPDPLMAVAVLETLAHLHEATGDLRGARADLDRALAIQRIALGPDHPSMASTLTRLARVLLTIGELDLAHAALDDALAIQQKAFGGDGQLAGAATRRELAKVLAAKGDFAGTIENLQQALVTQRRIFESEEHPEIATTLRELDRLQALQRDVQRPD